MPKTHLLMALAVLLAGPATAVAGSAEYQSLDAMGLASGKGMKTPCKISGEYEGEDLLLPQRECQGLVHGGCGGQSVEGRHLLRQQIKRSKLDAVRL